MSQELIFDRQLLIKRRSNKAGSLYKSDFLIKYSLDDIQERLSEISRDFPLVLNLGCRTGYGTQMLLARPGTKCLIETDISWELLQQSPHPYKIVADEEFIPFKANQFDLIISILNLHNVNDLPGCLVQLKRTLKPNGVLIASMFGERNLADFRQTVLKLELEELAGVSPRIMPAIDIKQIGSLAQRAGFSMPVVDKDVIEVHYAQPMKLLYDLQNMGETNIMLNRNKNYVGKDFWRQLTKESPAIAKFEILTLTAINI